MGDPRFRAWLPVVLALCFLIPGLAQAAQRRPKTVPLPSSTSRPETFGVEDYTVTSLSDLQFTPFDSSVTYNADVADYFRYVTSAGGGSLVTGAVLPAGAVIDYIGLGTCDTVGISFTVQIWEVDAFGGFSPIASLSSTAHAAGAPCQPDYNATALDYQLLYNSGRTIQIEVAQSALAPTDGSVRFSGVEIWWHRAVSPAPAVATFNDVPTDHPFFQYIEALAASGITGGCGSGNYCPDAPLTRGQMAVFLAKALGLHFPSVQAPD
jgi:S-layer homology domain